MTGSEEKAWYWCLRHKAPEREGEGCSLDQKMGPYPSREAAEHWKEKVEARNEAWEEEDREWEGDE